MTYAYFLLFTFVVALFLTIWMMVHWIIFSGLYEAWGILGPFAFSYLLSILLFFQGTRIRGWLDAI